MDRGGLERKSLLVDVLVGLRSLFLSESPVLLERDVPNAVSSSLSGLMLPFIFVGADPPPKGVPLAGNGDCDGRPVSHLCRVAPCATLA